MNRKNVAIVTLLVFVFFSIGCLQQPSTPVSNPIPVFTATPPPVTIRPVTTYAPIQPTPMQTPSIAVVSIDSNPSNGLLYIDSEYAGTTPQQIKLLPGSHFINIKMNGYLTYLKAISVSAGTSSFIFQLNSEGSGGDSGVIIPTPTYNQNWVTKEHDFAHTGISNSVDVLTPTIEWKKSGVVGTYDEWGGVIVVNGVIYTVPMTTETNMYAIDAGTHNIKWSYKVGKTNAPALYYNHIIYVQNYDGTLYALNEDGSLKWIREVPTSFDAGAMSVSNVDNSIFVSQGNPLKLYSYDLNTGNENWNTPLPWNGDCLSPPCSITFGTVYNNGVIYLSGYTSSSQTNYFAAYYSKNGSNLWGTSPIGTIHSAVWDSDILFYDNTLYSGIGNINYNVVAIYPNNGSLKWGQRVGGFGNVLTTPKIYNGILWVMPTDAQIFKLYRLNPNTGEILSNIGLDSDDNSIQSYMSPVLGNNYIYFTTTGGSHNKLYAFDYSGNKKWSYDFGSTRLFSQGALVNGKLYIPADDTTLYVFKG